MSRRTFRIALVGGIALIVLVTALAVSWFLGAGALHIYVEGGDHRPLHLAVPGAFVQAGLHLLPAAALADVPAECGAGAEWSQVIRAACDALARGPEGEYVRVESADEYVVVSKTRRHLLVHIEADAEQIRLEIPLRSLRSLGAQLAAR